ncbi:MAG: putative quinol monooxygenase [Dehalococcoidia bacterium]|jgi:quinol monooxygenase YgiN|nr:putative quinol monooxygenase [Dehalococcoidia bacterium]
MITVIAKLKAQEGKEPELEAALSEMVEAVSANEPGVPTYSLHSSDDDPSVFMFYEQYDDTDAQKAHGQTDHMKALGGKLGDLLDGRLEIERYTQVTGIER